MVLWKSVRRFVQDLAVGRGGQPRRVRRGYRRPGVEVLETRHLPSTLTPTTFADGGLGSGSLRDAVLQLNADTGTEDDTIQLLPGTYALTIRNTHGHENEGLEGDLDLTQTRHRWLIQGAGPSTVIDASQLQDRVFQIVNPGTQVVFQDLVIQSGLAQDNGTEGALPGTTDALGGGIFNNGGAITLDNLVLQNNMARGGYHSVALAARGGGLFSTGGSVIISDSTITDNQVFGGHGGGGAFFGGDGGAGAGGGIYSTDGSLTIADCTIASNGAVGGGGGSVTCWTQCFGGAGGPGQGGGIYASGGLLTLTNTAISRNTTAGGTGGDASATYFHGSGIAGNGAPGQGGGVYASGGLLTLADVAVSGNMTVGGTGGAGNIGRGGAGGESQGGGLSVDGTLTVSNSTITGNILHGGDVARIAGTGGGDANGGGLFVHGTLTVNDSTISGNTLQGGIGSPQGGTCRGGGVYGNGTLSIDNSTIAANTLQGGGSADFVQRTVGGASQGGGLYVSGTLTLSDSTVAANTLRGGDGRGRDDTGGASQGGGLYASGALTVSDSTVAANTLRGGDAGNIGANGGDANGGGVWVATGITAQLSFSTVATNQATGGMAGPGSGHSNGQAVGGGLYNQGQLQTRDTLLAWNRVIGRGNSSDPDLAGNLGSLGHNLVGNGDGGSGYDPTDLVGTLSSPIDPRLGPLADNGGPTQTMALLPRSPAIDAGDNTDAPEWDQRGPGYPRIVNGVIDIGAFEVQAHAHGRPTGQPLPDPLLVPSSPAPNALGPDLSISGSLPQAPAEGPGATDRAFLIPEASAAGRVAWEDRSVAPFPEEADGQGALPETDLEPVRSAWPPPPVSLEEAGLV
jgi:hypothetical protein